MNYLDLLPNDITKIINRKVQDLHIIERRKERKENRKMNREQEQKAYRRISDAVPVRPLTPRPRGLRVFLLQRLIDPPSTHQERKTKRPSSAPALALPADLRLHDSCSPRCPTQEKLCRTCPLESSRQLARCMPQSAG